MYILLTRGFIAYVRIAVAFKRLRRKIIRPSEVVADLESPVSGRPSQPIANPDKCADNLFV